MNNNYCIIMSGGIGSRFWPYSTKVRPKQFLDLLGIGRSLLRMTFDRFNKMLPTENIFIVSNAEYADLIVKEIPELDSSQILFEPTRRNTAPCIAFASYHIQAINPEANIVVAPSDHLILEEDAFIENIEAAFRFVDHNDVLLTLGIVPNRPETGYGYIRLGQDHLEGMTKVEAFTEKPNKELAREFLKSGEYFWNSGIFVWNLQSIMRAFSMYLPDMKALFDEGLSFYGTDNEEVFINHNFPKCQNISIDYGIMEKAVNVYVQKAGFGWSDLGTWGSLHEISEKDDCDNVVLNSEVLFFDSKDNIVKLPEGKIAVIQGLDGYVVAEMKDILMICKKEEEQRINQFVSVVNQKYGEKHI